MTLDIWSSCLYLLNCWGYTYTILHSQLPIFRLKKKVTLIVYTAKETHKPATLLDNHILFIQQSVHTGSKRKYLDILSAEDKSEISTSTEKRGRSTMYRLNINNYTGMKWLRGRDICLQGLAPEFLQSKVAEWKLLIAVLWPAWWHTQHLCPHPHTN